MIFARFTLSFIASAFGLILIIPAFLFAIPIWALSIFKKILISFSPRNSEWEDIILFDRQLGWKAKPNVNTRMKTDNSYTVITGRDGWRGNYSLKECDTLVIGDSFVFGQGTDEAMHFAKHTQSTKVKPIGAPGYGVTHYLLLLKSFTKELNGKLVIWFVFTGNDYRETIRPTSYGYHFPFTYRDQLTGNYTINTECISEKKLPFNFEKSYKTSVPELADLYYKNYFSDYAYGAFEYLLKEARDHCEKNDAKFAIMTIPLWWIEDKKAVNRIKRHCGRPEDFSPKYPDKITTEICKRHGVPFRAGTEFFIREDFLPNDFHFSNPGNKKASTIIDELYSLIMKKK